MTSADRVLAIGELLWDLLPTGPRLGGAPFNAVAHLAALGHPAALVTAVGADALGDRALAGVRAAGVDGRGVQVVPDVPTGTVSVRLDPAGVPDYRFDAPAAYEALDPGVAVAVAIDWQPKALILGTLAQRAPGVRAATRAIIEALPDVLVVYDANLRQGRWTPSLVDTLLAEADVLRCNEEELAAIGGTAEDLLAGFGLRAVVVTRGSAGAVGWSAQGRVEVPASATAVADTVGAGDAFTAGVTHALLAGTSLERALREGHELAARLLSGRPDPATGNAAGSPDER